MLQSQKIISFDTETTGIDAHQAELVGLSFSVKPAEAYYVPISSNQEKARKTVHFFKEILEDKTILKVGQNIKYDMTMMKWYGIEVSGPLYDTMITHYLCEPDLRHKLDYLTESYLDYKMVPIEDLIGKGGKNQLSMRDVDISKVKEYACEDGHNRSFPTRSQVLSTSRYERQVSGDESEAFVGSTRPPCIDVN